MKTTKTLIDASACPNCGKWKRAAKMARARVEALESQLIQAKSLTEAAVQAAEELRAAMGPLHRRIKDLESDRRRLYEENEGLKIELQSHGFSNGQFWEGKCHNETAIRDKKIKELEIKLADMTDMRTRVRDHRSKLLKENAILRLDLWAAKGDRARIDWLSKTGHIIFEGRAGFVAGKLEAMTIENDGRWITVKMVLDRYTELSDKSTIRQAIDAAMAAEKPEDKTQENTPQSCPAPKSAPKDNLFMAIVELANKCAAEMMDWGEPLHVTLPAPAFEALQRELESGVALSQSLKSVEPHLIRLNLTIPVVIEDSLLNYDYGIFRNPLSTNPKTGFERMSAFGALFSIPVRPTYSSMFSTTDPDVRAKWAQKASWGKD